MGSHFMHPQFDERDGEILRKRAASLLANPINVGDFVTLRDGNVRRVSHVWAWPDDHTKCDKCGDESNSAPNLTCGRSLGLDAHGEETCAPYCDGTYREVIRIESVQVSEGGSFYLGDGYVSFSGSLEPSLPYSSLVDTGDMHDGAVWFFHHDYHQAHNGVSAVAKFRVWRQTP